MRPAEAVIPPQTGSQAQEETRGPDPFAEVRSTIVNYCSLCMKDTVVRRIRVMDGSPIPLHQQLLQVE
jgi:hypothetical protein